MRRSGLIPVAALALVSTSSLYGDGRDGTVAVWAGQRPREPGASLLLRIEGSAADVDGVRIEFPEREWAESATAGSLPRGWTSERKRSRIELAGPRASLPIYLRLDSSDGRKLESVAVTVSSGKTTFRAAEVAVEQLPPVEVAGSAADRVLLPPLLTPGEAITLSLLDAASTEGVWSLGDEIAIPTGKAVGGWPVLRVRVPDPTSIDRPSVLSYVDSWGETIVRAPVLEQSRILPVDLPAPAVAHLGKCGLRARSRWATCTCGWFPTAESQSAILVDGKPAGAPVAASRRSVCVAAPAGPHRLSGAASAGFDPERAQETVALKVRGSIVGDLKPGQSATQTWTVTGTSEPVHLRLSNSSPGVGSLEGGDTQTAVTSGGSPNAVSRLVTGLTSGSFRVAVEIDEPPDSSDDREYPQLIAVVFQRELKRIAAQTEAAAQELHVERTDSATPPTVRRDDVLHLLDHVESELSEALPFPELAAFRDAASELIEELRREAMTSTISARSMRTERIRFVANDSGEPARLDEASARSLLSRLIDWLESNGGASPLRTLCIVTTPEDGAAVKMYPRSLPSDWSAVTSRSRLTLNLGRYDYEIQRRDYLPSKGSINLLTNPEQVFECPLARRAGDPTACKLLAQSVETCP